MTPEELQAIEERCNAATEGPWRARDNVNEWSKDPNWQPDEHLFGIGAGKEITHVYETCKDWIEDEVDVVALSTDRDYGFWEGGIACEPDAGFIAHSREDIPKLLTEVKRLQAELEELKTILMGGNGSDLVELSEVIVIPTDKVMTESPALESQKVFNAYMAAIRQFSLDGKKVKVLVVEE